MAESNNPRNLPYIILIGDVGSGKSTLLEKLTDTEGKSSSSKLSFTEHAEVYESFEEKLLVCDTPGSNGLRDKFKHNLHIALAMNFAPVTCVLIVVKADTRIDNVVGTVRTYAEGFIPDEIPIEVIGVCVTHMDKVEWKKPDLIKHLQDELGINTAVTSSLNTEGETLSKDLIAECRRRRPVKMSVDGDMFLKLFKISNNNLKILRQVKKEDGLFRKMVEDFFEQKSEYHKGDQMNMTFEFQAYMLERITKSQQRIAEQNNFTFTDAQTLAHESGHIASLTNQLRRTLSTVRIEAAKYHKEYDTNFRKCPHCPAIWQKTEGCDGETRCGSRPYSTRDDWSDVTSKFQFTWDTATEKLSIKKLDTADGAEPEELRHALEGNEPITISRLLSFFITRSLFGIAKNGEGFGCGKTIEWSKMAPVNVKIACDTAQLSSTKDVPSVPPKAEKSWNAKFDGALKALGTLTIKKGSK